MKEKFNEFWKGLTPTKKRNVVLGTLIGAVIIVAIISSKLGNNTAPVKKTQESSRKEIGLDNDVLSKAGYMENKKEMTDFRSEIDKLKEESKKKDEEHKKELDELKKAKEPKDVRLPMPSQSLPAPPTSSWSPGAQPSVPPPVYGQQVGLPPAPGAPSSSKEDREAKNEPFGDIDIISAPVAQKQAETTAESKKKDPEKVYLPSGSFMPATLLSGLDAPTGEMGQGHPVPALLRVKDLAILPNTVKANLKGCFIIAEGFGSLSTERAEMRLVSLSCIDKKGQSVIDQKVKGFLVDGDGKKGIRGKVVAKFGSTIARSFLAGFAGGFGDAVKQSATITSVGALGTSTQVLDTEKAVKAGVGSGIAQGAYELQKFYMKLAEQAFPVIEIGATRPVSVIFTEGVDLEIKEVCIGMGGAKCKGK